MRRSTVLLVIGLLAAGGVLVAVGPVPAYSDGYAGGSGAVPWYFLDCNTPNPDYCKYTPPGCGNCHGSIDDMRYQRASEQPAADRVSAQILFNGLDYDPDRPESYLYEPGRTIPYAIDVYIITNRAPGEYNKVGFNLNVSAGRFRPYTVNGAPDPDVRITGGNFTHAGSKNSSAKFCYPTPNDCRRWGSSIEDESDWAGELTHTARGAAVAKTSKGYHFRAQWYPPPSRAPHGVAFQMGYLVANSDGIDSCVYKHCNNTLGYSDQNEWDWWNYYIPRARFLCEKGQERAACEKAVYKAILPPTPPIDTRDPNQRGAGDGFGTPTWGIDAAVALAAAGLSVARFRPRRGG